MCVGRLYWSLYCCTPKNHNIEIIKKRFPLLFLHIFVNIPPGIDHTIHFPFHTYSIQVCIILGVCWRGGGSLSYTTDFLYCLDSMFYVFILIVKCTSSHIHIIIHTFLLILSLPHYSIVNYIFAYKMYSDFHL